MRQVLAGRPLGWAVRLLSGFLVALLLLAMAEHFDWPLAREAGGRVAAQPPSAGPVFTAAGELQRPANYRQWVFLTSGLGMTYGPSQPAAGRPPNFDNVFVTPAAYEHFVRTGTWPDQTMFVLEVRQSVENASINNGGRTQGGLAAMEAAVKDVTRFKDTGGWGYFSFDSRNGLLPAAKPLASDASCYACHAEHTAVDNTFVQFYPELFAIAQEKGTIRTTWDPNRKAQ